MRKRMGLLVCACMMALGASGEGVGMIAVKAAQTGEKIPITITAGSGGYIYTGQPQHHPFYRMNVPLAPGDRISVTVAGEATYVSDAGANRITEVQIMHDDVEGATDVTGNYEINRVDGRITIEPTFLMITANGNTAPYNGTPLLPQLTDGLPYQITDGGLIAGERITQLLVTGSQTEQGESDSTVDLSSLRIQNGTDRDTTENYMVMIEPGRLIVTEAVAPEPELEPEPEPEPVPEPEPEPVPVVEPEPDVVKEPEVVLVPERDSQSSGETASEPVKKPDTVKKTEPVAATEEKSISENQTVSGQEIIQISDPEKKKNTHVPFPKPSRANRDEQKDRDEITTVDAEPEVMEESDITDGPDLIEKEERKGELVTNEQAEGWRIWYTFLWLLLLLLILIAVDQIRRKIKREREKQVNQSEMN